MTSASDEEFNALLVGIHAADLAEIIEDLELHEGRSIVERLSHSNAADVLVDLGWAHWLLLWPKVIC